jgi:hypothetical protein
MTSGTLRYAPPENRPPVFYKGVASDMFATRLVLLEAYFRGDGRRFAGSELLWIEQAPLSSCFQRDGQSDRSGLLRAVGVASAAGCTQPGVEAGGLTKELCPALFDDATKQGLFAAPESTPSGAAVHVQRTPQVSLGVTRSWSCWGGC